MALRDLVLALLDPLGEGDLALAGEERHPPHLAQVEAHRVLGAADRARREVDRLRRAVVVVVLRLLLGLALADLRGQAAGLGGVHDLDVHRAEHHHDVVELVERHDVRREGVVHLVVGEEALLLAHRDQSVQLLQLRFFTHASELLGDPAGPVFERLGDTTRDQLVHDRALLRAASANSACIGAAPPVARLSLGDRPG